MATLVSPGVSVSVTNESFFFPVSAPTVPVFFIATKADKKQIDGITAAAGTNEHNVVRTVTSVAQSLELYGIPSFRNDISGNEFHGDARNEYGLLALNQFLGTGNRAFVVRANIDLTDASSTFISLGTPALIASTETFVGIGNGTLGSVTATNNTVKPQTFTVTMTSATTFTVSGSLVGFVGTGTTGAAFTSGSVNFTITAGLTAFAAGDTFTFAVGYTAVFTGTGNGTMTNLTAGTASVAETITVAFTDATNFTVTGSVSGVLPAGVLVGGTLTYTNTKINFTITAGTTPFAALDQFVITATSVTVASPLGATDALKRTAIVNALQAAVNSNTDLRSDLYEFNLIACPGYWEVADELVALATDVREEAMVIADTPSYLSPEQVAQWSLTTDRVNSTNIAYYYPWCLTSNLDGRNVLGAPSGTALRTIAYSDQQSYVWIAPAGVSRGVVTGASKVGYVSGARGTATTFVEANLNQGQIDGLYEYTKNVNPIVYFPGRGLLIWGQKTSPAAASALDRINVVRLVMYLRRTLRKGALPFVFEPNDQITRDNLKAAADGMLNDVLTKRGLYDFATLCDASNNTAARIEANELWLDVAIKPTKAAEFVYIPIRVVSTSASL